MTTEQRVLNYLDDNSPADMDGVESQLGISDNSLYDALEVLADMGLAYEAGYNIWHITRRGRAQFAHKWE